MLFEDRTRAESFGAVAEQYDRARPAYPAALIDALLSDGARTVLDVGCGTGIAAVLLAQRGADVLGVEPDARMAEVARAKELRVEVARFEDWDDRGRRFDLLTSGQAWHWVDPVAGARRAAEVLLPGGKLGVFWNFGTLPRALRDRLEEIYAQHAPELDAHAVSLGARDERIEVTTTSLRASGHFTDIDTGVFAWAHTYTTAAWIDQLVTHSDHQTLPESHRSPLLDAVAAAIDAEGGRFEMSYEAQLVTARRPANAGQANGALGM